MKNIFTVKNIAIAVGFTVFGGVLAWKWTAFDNLSKSISSAIPVGPMPA